MHAGTHETASIIICTVAKEFVKGGKQQSLDSFTDYHRENRITKKYLFVIIIIIIMIKALNHGQGKIKYPLTLILILHIQSGVWQSSILSFR